MSDVARPWYRARVKLYGYWRSTSSWRVRIVLALKKVEYENLPVHLLQGGGQQRTDAFKTKNPMMQVPVLEWREGGRTFYRSQSVAICEMLEEQYPDPPLLPSSPADRSAVRQLVEIVNAGIQPVQNLRLLQEIDAAGLDRKAWAARWIARGFDALEAHVNQTAGRYGFGDTLTLADVFLVPQVFNARRFDVNLAPYPTIVRIDAACAQEPAFAAAAPDQQPDASPAA